ncbi:MAG: cyclic nucleotide-binding domain-containing protein [Anaerolineae bacterium]|nr:cyclic nucleotide-binding domain-containing protein [Anaerolineae bacterium]MDW8171308.1 cyclic nucleotide-binding domain-containing protein [Anaerolineae bacterium]
MATSIDEISRFLAKVPLFRGLKERQLRRIAERMREREFKANEAIVEQGNPGVGLYIVVNGEARVLRRQADGGQLELDRLARTQFFGELSLLDEAPRSASVVADVDMKCLVLNKLDFLDELQQEPEMAIEMLKELAHRFRRIISTL